MRRPIPRANTRALPGYAITRAIAFAEPLPDGGNPRGGELEVSLGGLEPGEGDALERVEGGPTLGSGVGCMAACAVNPRDAPIADVASCGVSWHLGDGDFPLTPS